MASMGDRVSVSFSRTLWVIFVSALFAMACGVSHTPCTDPFDAGVDSGQVDSGDAGPEVEPGRRIPWAGVTIRFLGLTDLGPPNGNDVELRWHIDHPLGPSRFSVGPIFHTRWGHMADAIQLGTERVTGGTDVRVRLTLDEPSAGEVHAVVSAGLRLDGHDDEWWDVPPRDINVGAGFGPFAPRSTSFDGRLEIELVEAPDVGQRSDAWELRAGVEYSLLYRVHNRTDGPLDVHIGIFGDHATSDGPLERDVAIGPQASVDALVALRVDEPGTCLACLVLTAGVQGEERNVDGLIHHAEVAGP
jgi:hypothetical protein